MSQRSGTRKPSKRTPTKPSQADRQRRQGLGEFAKSYKCTWCVAVAMDKNRYRRKLVLYLPTQCKLQDRHQQKQQCLGSSKRKVVWALVDAVQDMYEGSKSLFILRRETQK